MRCPDCKQDFFGAFSCRQRGCCPSCEQKRALLLAHRLKGEVLADAPHRQWVFTIPKRLRVYFRYDRSLPEKLCRAAYDTVCDVFGLEMDGDSGVAAMIGALQTFGDLIHWQKMVFSVLLDVNKITQEVVENMRTVKHSGFRVVNSVRIEGGDQAGMQRLVEYIARCPFSRARMVSLTKDGTIIYRAAHPNCVPFPLSGGATLIT